MNYPFPHMARKQRLHFAASKQPQKLPLIYTTSLSGMQQCLLFPFPLGQKRKDITCQVEFSSAPPSFP